MCSTDLFLGILAFLFPPLPVWVKCGICSADSLINILLCCLGFIPGLLHAWYIIVKFPDEDEYAPIPQDGESGGRVRYIYVQGSSDGNQPPRQQRPPATQGYGTQGAGSTPSAQQQQQGLVDVGEGSSEQQGGVPPSYADVVAGDHKVQTRD